MTPERRQKLMDEAVKELRGRWGEVQPDALQAIADDLRTGVVENGALSVSDIVSQVTHGTDSGGLFGPLSADRGADKQRDMDLER